jgi:MoaA/NifB/PqqE/SkfB family radical SAM enzyme
MDEKFQRNRALNEKEIQEKKIRLESFPQKLIVTLSSRCNLDCIMCEVRKTKWDIPYKTIQEVIDLFPYLESIIWQGGEPFLLEYFEEIFDQAAKFNNLKQTIVTNGLLITDSWAEKLTGNNVELAFSIDGITKEVYEHIRERAKFERVLRSVRMIKDSRSRANFRKMALRLHVVVMKSNYRQLEGFIDFAKEYDFDAIHLIAMWGSECREENIFYNNDKEALGYIESIRCRLAEKAASLNIELLDSLPRPVSCETESDKSASQDNFSDRNNKANIEISCLMPWQQLNLDPGGGVRPGCLCLREIGSILSSRLMDLWNNQAMQSYRRGIIERAFAPICNQTCLSVQISEQVKKLKIGVS